MKRITIIVMLSISTLCSAMDKSFFRWLRAKAGTRQADEEADILRTSMNNGPIAGPAVPEISSLEDISFIEDPEMIAQECYHVANYYDPKDIQAQRKAELLALRNLEKQEELAREEYRLRDEAADLGKRMKRLDDKKKEIAAKHAYHKQEVDTYHNGTTPDVHSVLNDNSTHERCMQDCANDLIVIEKEIQEFKRKKVKSESKLKTLEVEILTLNQSFIRLRQVFNVHISKVAADQAMNTAREIKKRRSMVVDRENRVLPKPTNALYEAASDGLFDECKRLLDSGVDVGLTNERGSTALHCTARAGKSDLVKLLIDYGADRIACTKLGETALHCACIAGQEEIVKRLLDYWPQEQPNKREGSGQRYRLAGLCHPTYAGRTPLHCALLSGSESLVKCVNDCVATVDNSAEPPSKRLLDLGDNEGFTPLHLAVAQKNKKFVELLLTYQPDMNAVDKNNRRPLDLAIENHLREIVELLIETEMMSDDRTDGWDIIHWAAYKGYYSLVKFLIVQGECLTNRTEGYAPQTPLMIAQRMKHSEVVKLLRDQIKKAK